MLEQSKSAAAVLQWETVLAHLALANSVHAESGAVTIAAMIAVAIVASVENIVAVAIAAMTVATVAVTSTTVNS